MYERFYGLSEHPFSLTPDPDFIFMSQIFCEALDQITNAVNRREALTVLTGDVGTGKTTLCWALLLRMQKNFRTALILNPLLEIDDLLRAIIQDFNVKFVARRAPWKMQIEGMISEPEAASSLQGLTRKQLIDELNHFLIEGAEADINNVLVIDEAQNLSVECLEQLRILSNLETSKRKLLQIVFSGQLELDHKLNLPQLRPLKQIITVRCSLQPLSMDDMTRYIYHRIWRAGGDRTLGFSQGALNAIYRHSRGYPRLINLICDRALVAGYKNRSWNITNKMVKTAIEQLGMSGQKVSWFPSLFPARRVLTVTAALMILGLVSFVRPWNFLTNLSDHLRTKGSAPASLNKASSSMPAPLTQPTYHPPPEAKSLNSLSRIPGFSLQVHSMQTQQQADWALEDLKQKGYPVFQRVVRNPDRSLWYVVYVGPFAESEAAQEAAATLLQREELHAILRPYAPRSN